MKIALKTSKQLKKWGCKIEGAYYWHDRRVGATENVLRKGKKEYIEFNRATGTNEEARIVEVYYDLFYPAYDLIYDICIKNAKEFFGEAKFCEWLNDMLCPRCGYNLVKNVIDVKCNRCDFLMSKKHRTIKEHFNCGVDMFSTGVNNLDRKYLHILHLLQRNKQEEAEEYILENTIFNPRNKK